MEPRKIDPTLMVHGLKKYGKYYLTVIHNDTEDVTVLENWSKHLFTVKTNLRRSLFLCLTNLNEKH